MNRPSRRLPAWWGLLLSLLILSDPGASASAAEKRIYKWVDANGIAHYTSDPERIPKALRDRIETLERAASEPAPSFEPPDPAVEIAPPNTGAVEPARPMLGTAPAPGGSTTTATGAAPAPSPTPPGGEAWATRDALPRVRDGLLAEGEASPSQREALAREREALDARIAELEASIARDEDVLKDLITDPQLDEETPLFDRPEFLEVSQRLPELQAELDDLRGQRDALETP